METAFQQGLAAHHRGQLAAAEQAYRFVLQADARHFGATHLLGVIFLQRGMHEEAIRQIGSAVAINPGDAAAQVNLGNAQYSLGQFAAALASFDNAIALKPDVPDAFYNRGNSLRELGRPREAVASYARAIELRPRYPDALINRGNVLRALGHPAEALADYQRAMAQQPDYIGFYNKANALKDLGRLEEALASYGQALALRPDYADALANRGAVLLDLGRPAAAVADFDRVAALRPDQPEAFCNRGGALREARRLEEAIASYDRAIVLKPDYAEAYRNRGLCRLLAGDFAAGWPDHEHRWAAPELLQQRPPVRAPAWSGAELQGKSILVYAEQGLGDLIQFCRYLPMLADRGAAVTLLAPPPAVALTRTLPDRIRCVPALDPAARFDFQCALLSLPLGFGTTLATIPSRVPYLAADPRRTAAWRDRLGAGMKIGIAWQGNPKSAVDVGRSFPLAALAPIAAVAGVRLISLQKHHGLDQFAKLPPGMSVERLGEEYDAGPDAFLDTAAVLQHLDLVVTVDSAIAHLAGALGRPTWVALKAVPDWRWMLDRPDSPWYPTMRLFRQTDAGQWSGVFAAMATELNAVVGGKAVAR